MCPELKILFHFSVFLFNSTDKLIISDVDGTITKSDIKVKMESQKAQTKPTQPIFQGHVLPKLGMSAHHTGVVELFHKLDQRGYKIIYLTARYDHQSTRTIVTQQTEIAWFCFEDEEITNICVLGRVRWMMAPRTISLILFKR